MFGIGSLVGSFLAAPLVARLGRAGVLGLAQLVFGVTLAIPAITADAVLVGASFLLSGVSVMAWNITNVSLRQALVPPRLLGRVHATHRFVANVAGLLGALLAGFIGEAVSLEAVFAVGAAVVLASLAGRLIVTDARIAAAELEVEAPPVPAGSG
jgi:MFS family permease